MGLFIGIGVGWSALIVAGLFVLGDGTALALESGVPQADFLAIGALSGGEHAAALAVYGYDVGVEYFVEDGGGTHQGDALHFLAVGVVGLFFFGHGWG